MRETSTPYTMPTAPTTKKQLLLDAFLIVFGSFILAIGYSLFLAPAHISPGGVYGLALAASSGWNWVSVPLLLSSTSRSSSWR